MARDFRLAVLVGNDQMPPSSHVTLAHLGRVARGLGAVAMDAGRKASPVAGDLDVYDGLFIRETTAVDNRTFSWACRAHRLGIPVIDDSVSILTCCDKIAMLALLREADVPVPRGVILRSHGNEIDGLVEVLKMGDGPYVVKVPDGSFGRGMVKVEKAKDIVHGRAVAGLKALSSRLLVQPFIQSEFDWRVGVLDGEPLFACQYFYAKGHWQIIKHLPRGGRREGDHRTIHIPEVPPLVLSNAVKAARVIGRGLYGVDLKETSVGDVVVMEVNDNPNIEQGVEYPAGDDEVWTRIVNWFKERKRGEDC